MRLEAIRKNNHFMLPQLDKLNLKTDKVVVYIEDSALDDIKEQEKKTYETLDKLSASLGGDELIKAIMLGMPEDYKYESVNKTDKEIWYEGRKAKYE